jgi:phosphinothricin acetyltransferase
MGVEIRRAYLSDARSISDIYNQGIESRQATFETELRDAGTIRKWLSDHDRRHPVLVATSAGDLRAGPLIIGWASVSSYRAR